MNINAVKKCIEAFNHIETAQDLKRAKITLAEYREIYTHILQFVQAMNQCAAYYGETISQGVCDWFMKHGAKVEPCGIGWRISF